MAVLPIFTPLAKRRAVIVWETYPLYRLRRVS